MDKKKRILIINTAFNRGGAARIANKIHTSLLKDPEFEVFFIFSRGTDLNRGINIQGPLEFYMHHVISLLGFHGCGSLGATIKAIKIIQEKQIDLIHLHNIHGYFLNYKFIKWLIQSGIPTVWTLHDAWPITGRCAYFFGCDRWIEGCGSCPDLKSYPRAIFDFSKYIYYKKKALFSSGWEPWLITPSDWLKRIIQRSFMGQLKIKTINNGIQTDLFKPLRKMEIRSKYHIPQNKQVILFLSEDIKNEGKGVKYYLRAVKQLKHKEVILLTVGNSKAPKDLLPKKIRHIHFGHVSSQKIIAEIFNIADLYVSSSLQDNFPNTVIEAMSCGLPVVGFKSGGIVEQVSKDTGILVETRDIKNLAEAIDRILGDDLMRKRMSAAARERVINNFPLDKMLIKYKKLYNSVLG